MKQILDDVLDISKIEAGKLDIEPAPFDPWGVVEHLVEMREGALRSQGKPIAVSLEPRGEEVHEWVTDRVRFTQIASNIIGNACKFTDSGYVKVTLGLVPGPGSSALLRLMCEDTGPGIAPEQLTKLFEPFSQAKPSVVRRFGGTGLGLAISKLLIEMLGGSIHVRSELGSGSVFW